MLLGVCFELFHGCDYKVRKPLIFIKTDLDFLSLCCLRSVRASFLIGDLLLAVEQLLLLSCSLSLHLLVDFLLDSLEFNISL